jgi:hypothetical protein
MLNSNVEIISTIFTGLVGLLTAAAGLNFSRNKKLDKAHKDLVAEFTSLKREVRILRKLDLLKTRHIRNVEKAEAQGLQIPPQPDDIAILEAQLEALEEAQLALDTSGGDEMSKV